jgi:hypothetical protein
MNNTQKFCVVALGGITLGLGAMKSPSETTPPEISSISRKNTARGHLSKNRPISCIRSTYL